MKHDQAFPVHYNGHEGMTLRDYFASKAMQLIMAETISSNSEITDDEVALASYRMAEAMLNAREL